MHKRTSIHKTFKKPHYYKHKPYDFTKLKIILREDWKMVTLISIFLSGMIIGSITAKYTDNEINSKLVTMFSDYTMLRNSQSIFETFISSFKGFFIYLAIVFIFGFCAIGIPVVALVPLGKGIGLGMIAGHLYSTYALTGAGYCMVILFPSAIISTAALLFGCNESFIMSYEIFNIVSGKYPNQNGNMIKKYSIRFAILLVIIIFAALIETIMTVAFADKFTL